MHISTLLQSTILPLQTIQPTEETLAMADSAKVAMEKATELLVTNPSAFFSDLMHDSLHFGIKVLAAVLLYIVGAWIIKLVKKALERSFKRRNTEGTIVTFTTSFVSVGLTVLLVIIIISTLGVNTTSLAALLAAGGMAIGMALSGTVQNFAGGIMILVFKPFRAGDYIKAMGYEGFVEEVTMVNTKLRTFDNNIIVLPNGNLSNGTIDNFSHKPFHREAWKVSVSYGTDFKKAKEVIEGIIKAEPRILDSSTQGIADPAIYVSELADSSVNIIVYAWVKTQDYWPVRFKMNEEIYTKLPTCGVSFPFPQMDVHIKND